MIGVIEMVLLIPIVLVALSLVAALLFSLWKIHQLSQRVDDLERQVAAMTR